MFEGFQEYNLDDKGRILLPIKYRGELGDVVMLSFGGGPHINIWPKPVYDAMKQRLQAAGGSENFPMTSRIAHSAIECEVDRQGRIVVPSVLRRFAKLGGEVIIIGNDERVEIWDPDIWQQAYDRWVEQQRQTPDNTDKARDAGLRFE